MNAINRFNLGERQKELRKNKPCVFISHQKKDTEACKKIADYLLSIRNRCLF